MAIKRQREDRELVKQNREKGIKNFQRLVIENVFAYLEKLGIKITPAYSLEMTKIHVGLVATLSNMVKAVRKLRKMKEEREKQKVIGINLTNCQEAIKKMCLGLDFAI
jgi:Pyruvate/2-oxoacid:ferredoxin oxidoreductase gamma subunit